MSPNCMNFIIDRVIKFVSDKFHIFKSFTCISCFCHFLSNHIMPYKDTPSKPNRQYLGWEDAAIVEWKVAKEYEGRKLWAERWGHGKPWMNRYNKWICSGMNRAMRKPSFRSLEWLAYQRRAETAPIGEYRTRKRYGLKDYFLEPLDNYHCCPCPYPITTAGEIGWLGQHKCCQLEIYGNDFMQKPPIPAHMTKISAFLSNSQ
ncbi:uncharacterized protein LOC110853578 [Folsomia candida]|uniref:Uncharacterized protein n=1 Tax=Folsomia candida TaxID=158441 RepID=A0A226E2S0_FOLCA|nr:uncharacterized protein LOC110853578 [Folsomia candida]OXA51221.1 hypothetical protein Fcan01_14523 [Folsomia candida]